MDALSIGVHLGALFGSLGALLEGFGSQRLKQAQNSLKFLSVQVFAQEAVLERFWAPSWIDFGRFGAQNEAPNCSENGLKKLSNFGSFSGFVFGGLASIRWRPVLVLSLGRSQEAASRARGLALQNS